METLLVLLLIVTTLILAGIVVLIYGLWSLIGIDRGMAAGLALSRSPLNVSGLLNDHEHPPTHRHNGAFVVWVWRNNRWNLVANTLPLSVEPGPPPSYRGEFENHVVRTWVSTEKK